MLNTNIHSLKLQCNLSIKGIGKYVRKKICLYVNRLTKKNVSESLCLLKLKTNVVLSVKLISHHINRNWIKKLFTFQIDPGMTDLKRVLSLARPSISELLSLN